MHITSHDLKQPLCTAINFSKLLVKDIEQSQNPENKLYLQHILNSSRRMINLIEDILEYSTLGKKNKALEIIDWNELIAEGKETITDQLIANKIVNSLPSVKYDKRLSDSYQ